MIESAYKTFMPIQTLDLQRVAWISIITGVIIKSAVNDNNFSLKATEK